MLVGGDGSDGDILANLPKILVERGHDLTGTIPGVDHHLEDTLGLLATDAPEPLRVLLEICKIAGRLLRRTSEKRFSCCLEDIPDLSSLHPKAVLFRVTEDHRTDKTTDDTTAHDTTRNV